MEKRSYVIGGRRTSISVESVFWEQLDRIALQKQINPRTLVVILTESRGDGESRSVAIREFVIHNLQSELISAYALVEVAATLGKCLHADP